MFYLYTYRKFQKSESIFFFNPLYALLGTLTWLKQMGFIMYKKKLLLHGKHVQTVQNIFDLSISCESEFNSSGRTVSNKFK